MNQLPLVQADYQPLYDMVLNPIRSKLLKTGVELGVFDLLEDFRSDREVAGSLDTHPGNTLRLLNALATVDLVEKKDGLFKNRPIAMQFLMQSSPTFFGPMLHLMEQMCVAPMEDLGVLVKNGPAPQTDDADIASEAVWAEATRAGASWVTGGAGVKMAKIISELPEFGGFRKMLDLGGGHGMFTLYFVQAHPEMTGVIFDRPAVASVAEELIEAHGMGNRVWVMKGDYLTDDIGGGYDLVWACSTLNFARPDLDPLVTKVYDALNPGGVFIAFQDGLTHEGTRPDVMLGFLAESMRQDRDYGFLQGEIAEAMLRCGFRSVRSRTVRTPMEEMDLDIARK